MRDRSHLHKLIRIPSRQKKKKKLKQTHILAKVKQEPDNRSGGAVRVLYNIHTEFFEKFTRLSLD